MSRELTPLESRNLAEREALARHATQHPHEPEIRAALDGEGRCRVCALLAERDDLRQRLSAAEEALRYLAERDNWVGDPRRHAAEVLGHFTPYELARLALGLEEEPEGG